MTRNPDFFVHEAALVESDRVGAGTKVWAFAHIMKDAVVGMDCMIGDYAFIESGATLGDRVTVKNSCLIWHGVHIGSDVFIGPNVVFTNDLTPRVRYQTAESDWLETEVGDGASLGANSTILCGIRIGSNALIGAGSVVTGDVQDHGLVVGNPARPIGWACECGRRLDRNLSCSQCLRHYHLGETGLKRPKD